MVSPSRLASGSKLAPWTRVEVTTTKKTIANSCLAAADPGDDREGGEPDRRRAAQPGPAEHRPLAHVERREGGGDEGGERAGDEDQHRREREALPGDVAERAGEDEQAEQDEEADLGDPADPLVEGDDRAPGGDAGAAPSASAVR